VQAQGLVEVRRLVAQVQSQSFGVAAEGLFETSQLEVEEAHRPMDFSNRGSRADGALQFREGLFPLALQMKCNGICQATIRQLTAH
jgi:hypothetical protein